MLYRGRDMLRQAAAIENIIAQDQGHVRAFNIIGGNIKTLGDPPRFFLCPIGEFHPPLTAITQQAFQLGQGIGRGNHDKISHSHQHHNA